MLSVSLREEGRRDPRDPRRVRGAGVARADISAYSPNLRGANAAATAITQHEPSGCASITHLGLIGWIAMGPCCPLQIPSAQPRLPRNTNLFNMAKAVAAASSHKAAKKKKWSKGKVKDKANNHVICDKPTYDKIFKEVPTYKMISQSVLIDRMKINGSLARVAIQHLEREGLIKRIVHHRGQLVYTRATAATE
ncbi:hypothetical protein PCASD_05695 [Puccinia coronata f. sp. avenae]|uniref:40S ribosomal protein S25 n=2 Tax=Puccinia coronata f. sp. avenae TaxID=200324 RepID=A0A2N5UVG3_9BASI|nr:hypothetical protein PCASD_05695 [Puccinia coronata f. sp. avenae]